MKLKTLAFASLLTVIGVATPAFAQHSLSAQRPTVVAGFFDNIIKPAGGNSGNETPSSGSSSPQAFKGFSGQYSDYVDTFNGFKLKVPTEFTLHDKGMTTDWTGPLLDGGAATIYINAAPLKGVPSATVYSINLKSKKEDRNYTEIVPMKVKIGNKIAPAFRCKESKNKPGTPDLKAADDIHRWHLFVFANQTVYTMGFTGPFASFQSNKLQSMYEDVIKSVEIVPVS